MKIAFYGSINERTGYGVHASRFVEQLRKFTQVTENTGEGNIHLALFDVVTAGNLKMNLPHPSILYTVWESTEYPAATMDAIAKFDWLWVPSEWQRACSIAQGIPEEKVKVVPEGVDPVMYLPDMNIESARSPLDGTVDFGTFNFVHVGQWQPRKSTLEICQSFIKAFPDNPNVRLYLSADTLFPSDACKDTEERLITNGINDSRIIPVHYEERESYIRRLQSAQVFVTCARSEGWNLPLIEAMACGVPAICADFGGSTEYATDAITIPISELRKPHGIYGDWDVPGKWGEPDYNKLTETMKAVYDNYSPYKTKALHVSNMIRTKFSWEAAAKKAMVFLEEIVPKKPELTGSSAIIAVDSSQLEKEIVAYARKYGYDIQAMKRRRAIFSVDCWPDTPAKMDTLKETITQIHMLGYEVLVTSHYPIPTEIMTMADYFVYEKKDILSGDDLPVYWRQLPDGSTERKQARIPYHAVAGLNNIRNGVNIARGKYDWIYQMSFDVEVDLKEWIDKVLASEKDMVCLKWQEGEHTFGGHLMAAKTEIMDKIYPYLNSWKEYADQYPEHRFLAERWLYEHVSKIIDIENTCDFIKMDIYNRFDQTDRTLWGEDTFTCHFIEGPFLEIHGSSPMSNREYDVSWSFVGAPNVYNLKQKANNWSRPNLKYFRDWFVNVSYEGKTVFEHKLDMYNKRVLITLNSKALGDTLAWMPYVEEFRKKYNAKIYCATWWRHVMDYPEIEFITPGSVVPEIYASYDVGCFDDQLDKNKKNWRDTNLQQVASDILGLEYKPLRAKLKYKPLQQGNGNPPKPTVCFSEFSTMRNKLWNKEGGWQKVIDYLVNLGYECVSISAEKSQLKNITSHNGQEIEDTIADVAVCEFYIGLNAGPSWIAYSLGKPCLMITGVSKKEYDFPNEYRVAIDVCIPGCFHDLSIPLNRGFEWCPRNKDYICTKEITEEMVIEVIDKIRRDHNASSERETAGGNGDSGTRTEEAVQTEQSNVGNEQAATQ